MSKEWAHELAKEHVIKEEERYADELIADIHNAHRAMDGCGCPQCKNWFWGAVERAEAERDRLKPPGARVYNTPLLPSGDVLDEDDTISWDEWDGRL